MKKKLSIFALLVTMVASAMAQTNTNGPIVTFTNVQKDGTTTFTLYINENNELAISNSSAAELGDAAKFRAIQKDNGKWAFYNESKRLYMIWRGKGNGYNSDKGVLAEYNATYCDWTMNASANLSGGYYFVGKRSNGTSDGSLVILKAGTFDAYGNSEGWADGHTNVYKIESEEYTATLTDNQGTAITCTTTGFPVPSYSGATLSNPVWADGKLAATVGAQFPALPFPLSSAEVTNPTFISSFKTGGGNAIGRFKWYAPDADDVKVKRDAAILRADLDKFSWAIYASLENGAFAYSIKNIAKDKYIYSEASYAANNGSHGDNVVILSATPTKFKLTTDGENRFYYVVNNVNQYLSSNSTGDADAQLGVYAKTHNGTTNSFHTPAYDLSSKDELVSGGIYAFVTSRGWVGANDGDVAIATVNTSVTPAASTENAMFQWALYQSKNGNYYLYNLGKQKFLGVPSQDMASIPLADEPMGKKLTFKDIAGATSYPIMFSPNNTHAVSQNSNAGLFGWAGGWNRTDDAGSNHKVSYIGSLTADQLKTIADLVEAYDRRLYVKAEVEGSWENNPNTHFGRVRATSSTGSITTKLNIDMDVVTVDYDGLNETTIDFTRDYRGFEFQGYSFGGVDLGKNFTLTEELASSITAENPLVAKFRATDDVTIWYDDDPFSYRIPAIGKTSSGRLIAVSDYRYSLDDIGRYNYGTATPGIDLVIRMSDDNGKTWGETKTIAKGSCVRNTNDCAYGDAAIAVVGQKVLVMGAAGDVMFGDGSATAHNRTVRIFSEDNGVTWTDPQDISETLFIGENATIKNGYTAFFGSGKLAVDEHYNGTDVARIYGAMLIKKEGCGNAIYVIYTDDFGVTWDILGGSQTHITANDEPKVEILPSGQILLSVRRGGGRQFNVFTYSDKATNEGSWNSNVNGCSNGGSNTCNGEIYVVDAKKADGSAVKLLLQSQPKGGGSLYDRRNVTIWYKEITDAAYTSSEIAGNWIEGMQVSNQLSSYSTMVLQNDGKIAFFFEEAPCYGDDYAKGYSMVYTPLTIEGITKGKYFSPTTDLNATQTISVVLTDAQGNDYRCQVQSGLTGIAAALTTQYPYITLGNNANIGVENGVYTYTNTVTLPFKVSNEEEIWHNIYFPINTNEHNYPAYMSAAENSDVVKIATESAAYGNSTLNTLENAGKISWAIYQSEEDDFAFILKNKSNGQYLKTTSAASTGTGGENVRYTANLSEAAAFVPSTEGLDTSYQGEYSLKIGNGCVCVWSVGNGYVTYSQNKGHKGAWAKFVEAPDFEALIADINGMLSTIGASLGQYTVADAEALEDAKAAMENSNTLKLNTLNSYKTLLEGATLNMPKAGQYFRVAYDYGGSVGKLYMQSTASSVKGLEFTSETGDASIWYLQTNGNANNAYSLYAYTVGASKNLREHGDDRGLHATKTNAEFIASTRAKGKYNIKCGSFVHASSSNGEYYTDHCSGNSCAAHDLILELVDVNTSSTIMSSIGEYKMGTFYANQAVIIPEGVTAYIANAIPEVENGEGTITMVSIKDGIIPAQTGVLICGEKGSYGFTTSAEPGATNTTGNLMKGYAGSSGYEDVVIENGYSTYVLTVKNGEAGFYKKESNFKVYNNKAYLQVPTSSGAAALRIRFAGATTEIAPSIFNSHPSTEVYDLLGRKVETMKKGGLYIVNGKKVIF